MKTSLVLTVVGPDQPGLVEAISRAVADHGGNWEASRMGRLGGQFAGMVQVGTDEAGAEALAEALLGLEARGLHVVVVGKGEEERAADLVPLRLDLVGTDRPGILREISAVLASRHVNVDELETECTSAPMSGEALFRMSAALRAPRDVALADLTERLEALANDLMVDVTLAPEGEEA
ncbi:MAG: glycine cleavage system protein R [Myxococcota bacterium]